MRAMVITAPMEFGVKDVPTPKCPEGGVLLRVHACGLCGSDLRTLRSGHRKVTMPFTLGHEISGEVVETSGNLGWRVGEKLAVGPLVYCGRCPACLSTRFELCDGYREIAQAWAGGFAEYIALPAEAIRNGTIQRIPDGMDPAVAAVAEPASSVVNAQEKGNVGLGDVVVILGAGPIGFLHASLARARGAEMVIMADISDARLKLAECYPVDHLVNSAKSNVVAEVRRLTGGLGADVIVTANPAPEAQVAAVEMARKGGRVLLFGGLPKEQSCPPVNTNTVHYNALSLIGTTIFAPRHFQTAMRLLASGRIDAKVLISHRFPLEQFNEGAALALAGEARKVVFLP